MSEQKNDIEIFDSEDEIIIEPLNNKSLYDIKGNLITADDARNTLPENTDLIQKAMNGDKKAFETLYMQSYRYVFFVARQYIPDDETTYDVIQETFIKVYKNISGLRSPEAFYGWITAVVKNTALDMLRSSHTNISLSENIEDYSEFLTQEKYKNDVSLDIETVLRKLDPQDAELLSLVYYDGMRINAIAKMQGVPATTVYSRLNRAKRNLKAQLNARGIDKAIYSGNFVSMVTVAIRNIIGTALLSVAIAQQILDSIINGKGKKEITVAKIIRSQQKKAILKIASVIVAISVITSMLTVLSLVDWKNFLSSANKKQTVEYHYTTEYQNADEENTSSESSGNFWQNLFGGNSSQDSESDEESSSSGGFWSNLFGSNNKDNDSSSKSSSQSSSSNSGSFWQNLFGNGGSSSEQSSSSSKNESSNSLNGNTHESEDSLSSDGSSSSNSSTTNSSSSNSSVSSTSSVSSVSSSSNSSSGLSPFTPPTVPDTFMPDCDPSQYNTSGNLCHNTTLHIGEVARQGDWIYYAAQDEEEFLLTNLYKVKTDGTKKQVLVQNIMLQPYINVVGEWIYFISGHILSQYHLARVRTDGTGYQQLTDFKIDGLQVIGDTAYFYTNRLSEEPSNYYKMNLITGEITLLIENISDIYACMTDKYFLYRPDGSNTNLCVYDNKTGALVHNFKASGLQVYNNKILVAEADEIALYDLDHLDAEPKILAKTINEYLFYSPYNDGIICGKIESADGQSNMGIFTISNSSFQLWPFGWEHLSVDTWTDYSTFDDGYVYYVNDEKLYRCYPDGTELKIY